MCRFLGLGWRSSWIGLFCIAALLLSHPAHAGQPAIYVDPALACAGRTPCFATIQEGVRNAMPGALVNVFPADYAESVDIGLMGDAIGGPLDDLTLRTVNGAAIPTPGTASIMPASGAGIFNSVAPFTGDLSIDGFTIQSPDDSGIEVAIEGTVNLSHLVCDGNQEFGFVADLRSGDVNVTDSSFSNNESAGLQFATANNVNFERVTANGNGDDGAAFVATGNVRVSESTFNENKDDNGLVFVTDGDVDFERVTASSNVEFGANFVAGGNVRIYESHFDDSKDQIGLAFVSEGDVSLEEVTALRNAESGATFVLQGNLYIGHASFNDNQSGDGLLFQGAVDVTFERVNADRNADNGARFLASGNVSISHSSFSENKGGTGLSIINAVNVTLEQVVADGNRDDGAALVLAGGGSMRVADSSFSDNTNGTGLTIVGGARLEVARIVASRNGDDGLVDVGVENATIVGSRFEDNAGDGVILVPSTSSGEFVLRCNDIAGNARGLVVAGNVAVLAENNYWGSPSGPTHPSNPAGTGDSIVDGANGGAGTVDFIPFLIRSAAESGQCATDPVPALDTTALAVLLFALFLLPARRLARARLARPS